MKTAIRCTLLAGLLVVALAQAGPALAAYGPSLAVSMTPSGTTIGYAQSQADDATAKLQFFAPIDVTPTITPSAGTLIGEIKAKAAALDLGGAVLPLSGTITAAGAADAGITFGGAATTVGALATICTGTGAHTAYWIADLFAAGQKLQVPLFVDALVPPDPRSAFASAVIQVCLAPPDVPSGTPGRAAFGAKLLETSFTLKGVFTAGPGEYRWRLVATPFQAQTGAANALGTVEVQSLSRTPVAATLKGKGVKGKKRAAVSGTVTEAGKPVAGAKVEIVIGSRVIGTGRTNAAGKFSFAVKLPTARARLQAKVTVATRPLGAAACAATFTPQGIPCTGATVGGFAAFSNVVAVRA